ncbi:MAG: pyruvate synthase subunit PorA [Gammaproteobacteria bacterium]|nr:MAG: pyruvate synthase subunit PorA [Gammaproteobacteria bacterium]
MDALKQPRPETRVITGNAAAAYAVRLCRPDVVSLYPITPQSEVIETLERFHANGTLDAEMVQVEGENSAQNVVCGASMAGARVFTATSSYGLVFMYDAILQTAGYRAPVVMVNVNREPPGIHAVCSGQQDMIATRDSGWIQVIAESVQEILDLVIMAYRLAEDREVLLPIMVNYDGFYLSFLAESVEIPEQEAVDRFLAPLNDQPPRPVLEPGSSKGCGAHGLGAGYVELRRKHMAALDRARGKFDEVDALFGADFGRSYGGQIDCYRTDDAEIILVTSGSAVGTARTVIDAKRAAGVKVGLVKIRMFRPFPIEVLTKALQGRKAIGVLDRSIAFGWDCGPMYQEIRALTPEIGTVPLLSFIDGLANMDITKPHIERVVDDIQRAALGHDYQSVTWIASGE